MDFDFFWMFFFLFSRFFCERRERKDKEINERFSYFSLIFQFIFDFDFEFEFEFEFEFKGGF